MKTTALIGFFLILLSAAAQAETMYVTNTIKITLRTGPGTNHKVLRMLNSGISVELLEAGEDWSLVQLPDGTEGWILSRFISSNKPSRLVLRELAKKYEKLLSQSTVLQEENKNLKAENERLSTTLDTSEKTLSQTSSDYTTLKKDSAKFLELKEEHEKAAGELSRQSKRAKELREQLLERNIMLMLAGAGVLLLGFIIGFSTKKSRRRSSLLS
jgi:SH3 domain protein